MDKRTLTLVVGASAVAAATGLGAGSLIWRTTPDVAEEHGEEHAEGEEHGEEAEGGTFVALTPAEAAQAGVQLASVTRGGGAELLIPGRAAFAPNAEAAVGAPLTGVVEAVHVAVGARVGQGAPLLTIRSAEGASLRASADAARAEVEAAQAAYQREARLFRERVTARQDLEAARAASLKAEADLRAAQAQIAAVGSPGASGRTTIRSPMRGTVTNVAAAPGAVVSTGAPLVQVADQNRVELIFEAPAAASRSIAVGSTIVATMAGGEETRATVIAISPHPADAGAQVRARPVGPVPPAGTPLSGRVITGAADTLVVPIESVQTLEGRSVVFVSRPNGFQAQSVVIGRTSGGRVEIVRGLTGEEKIAGRGAFLLRAELSRGEAEHEH